MSNKTIILIDMDGVLCEWVRAAIQRYQLLFPHLPYTPEEQLSTFYMEDSWPSRAECINALHEVLNSPRFYRNLEPVAGGVEALKNMQELTEGGAPIEPRICTSPWTYSHEQDCFSDKALWVEEHLGRWWTNRLILAKDKTLVRGHILIDDKPEIRGALQPTWQQLLYDRSWNRHSSLPRFTWSDWPQLRDSILASHNNGN